MELDMTGVSRNAPVHDMAKRQQAEAQEASQQAKHVARKLADEAAEAAQSRADVERYLSDIVNYAQFFNKRLRFSINEELDQVVVKVIDSQTDKVIKEIPPEVLQRLHVRIREAIGLLIDEII